MATMSKTEKEEFDRLYEYVKSILNYGDDMALPKYMVMRLKGLSDGKYYANNKIKNRAKYSYKIVLLTFMYCKNKINKALQTKKFENEQNKFNYIMVIVQNNLNDVVLRLKAKEKSKQEAAHKIDKLNIDIINNDKTEESNTATTNDKTNDNFDNLMGDMW